MVSSADPAVSRRDFAAGETGRGPFIPTNRASNPRAGQWTNAMSHNMIADYKRFLMTDGEGIRCSLYVSGCPFHCEGCYNSSIWDFRAGHEYNDRLEAQIMADLSLPYVQGITFLGGEPLLNTGVLLPLSRKIRERFGRTKDIGAGRATRGRSSCAKAKAPTSVNCSNRSISSWMAGISRICTIRCCSSRQLQPAHHRCTQVVGKRAGGAVVETTRSDAVHSRNLRQGPRRRGGGRLPEWFRTVRVRTVGIRQADYIRCLIMRRVVRFMRYRAELGRGTDYHYILG